MELFDIDGGWCIARMLDGEFHRWLCPHAHPTPEAADECPERESLLGPATSNSTNDKNRK